MSEMSQDCHTPTEPQPSEVAREKAVTALNAARYVVKAAIRDIDAAGLDDAMDTVRALDLLDKVQVRAVNAQKEIA